MESVFHCVVAVINLAIGIYVFAKNPRAVAHRSFFVFTFGIFVWSFGMFLLCKTQIPFFIAPTLLGGEITLAGFVLLAETFPDGTTVRKFTLLFLTPLFVLMLLTPTRLFISSVDFSERGHLEPENGPWFSVFVLVMAAYAAWGFWKFLHRYRRLVGVRRIQMTYLLLGAGIFIAAALVFDVLLPAFHVFAFNLLGPIFSMVFVIATAYAIVRHRLLDIEFALKRGVTYALTLLTIAAVFFSIEFIIENLLYREELADIIAGIIGGLLFSRIRCIFETLTDRFFFRKDYDYGHAVQNLGERLNRAADLEALAGSLDELLTQTVKPERSVFYVGNANAAAFRREVIHDARLKAYERAVYEELFGTLPRDLAGPVFIEELSEGDHAAAIAAATARSGIAAIVPLAAGEGIRGAIFLGKKLSDAAFSSKDRALLAVLARQVGMALENLRFAEEAVRFKHVQESQSKFLADIAHELQTPVAILKANVEVVGGKQSGDRATSLRVMEMTLDRMSQMIVNLLAVARLNFSKEKLHKMPIDVHTMLEEVHGDCLLLAEERGVVLSFSSDPVTVAGDGNKLREVVLNLVSNALKHTPRGGSIALRAGPAGENIEISVIDTGSGIPAENMPHIFERFYRIDGAGSAGTGLGLNICRQIVEAHGGSIRAESEVGEGSTFIIALPRYAAPEEEEK